MSRTKTKYRYSLALTAGDKESGHFFASSIGAWRTGVDLEKLISDMKRDRLSFNLFWVPLPSEAGYAISSYAPQVPGVVWLGVWTIE